MTDQRPTEMDVPTRSSRDPEELRALLERWLETRLPAGAQPAVGNVDVPSSNGMSSETLLFDASWEADGTRHEGAYVARIAPADADVPVFPTYDLEMQFRVMQLVGERSEVPVPRVLWLELDEAHIGGQFFVMERAEGRVPPDVMPYNMGSWVSEASADEQAHLQRSSVEVLARLHAIDVAQVDCSFLAYTTPGDTPLRRHVAHWRAYYDWMREDVDYPVLEAGLAWLEDNWPTDEGQTVVSWGDSRIGNMMYDGFTPSAVLDWEMAGLGPRGIDLGWMAFIHQFFEGIAVQLGTDGMPDFLRADELAGIYEELTGISVPDMRWYEAYAALRHGIVMARVNQRSVHFGDAEPPAVPDEAVMHRDQIYAMVDGSYWD